MLLTMLSGTALAQFSGGMLVRQPYVQSLTSTEVTLVWMTLDTATSTVRWGPDVQDQERVLDPGTQHQARLQGLEPDTRYEFTVLLEGVEHAKGWFQTAPERGSTGPVRIWVVGDSGVGTADQFQVRDAMLEYTGISGPDLYLHVGDMAYGSGTEQEFTENFFVPYERILDHVPVWPAIGNHEAGLSNSGTQTGPYYEAYVLPTAGEAGGVASGTEAYYSFDYANVHVVVLDSQDSDREVDGAMLTWLVQDLAANDQDWLLALWHHPPYTKGSHNSDTESQLIDMRENALPILEANGVDMVFTGHSHIYERSYLLGGAYETPSTAEVGIIDGGDGKLEGDGGYLKPAGLSDTQGAVYVTAGHGGTGVTSGSDHPLIAFREGEKGSVLVDVHDNRLTLRNIRMDGVISDTVTLVKGAGIVLTSPNGGALEPGSSAQLSWATVGSVSGPVSVDWSCDGGESWISVAEGVALDGGVDWSVPRVHTEQGMVRVSAASGEWDVGDAPFVIPELVVEAVVPWGSVWSYEESGESPESGWKESAPSGWSSGPGQLGYGEGDEATQLSDAEPHPASVYFRRSFESEAMTSLELQVLFDDGVVVWLDGVELLAERVSDSTHESWASSSTDNQIVKVSIESLSAGTHELAVMVKQVSATSSDLSFDLQLLGAVGEGAPGLCADGQVHDTGGDTQPNDTSGLDSQPVDSEPLDSPEPQDSQPPDSSVQDPPTRRCGCGAAGGLGFAWLLGGLVLFWRRRAAPRSA